MVALALWGAGQSYGGGAAQRGGGGGAGGMIWIIFQALVLLVYLTIEYPIIGFSAGFSSCGG